MGVSPTDAGDLAVPHHATRDANAGATNAKHIKEVKEVTRNLTDTILTAFTEGMIPLALGGDRSIAIGSLVGSAHDADIGIIWFDAHGDLNTPSTSPSGNIHGMPLAAALSIGDFTGAERANAAGFEEENITIVGLHFVDDAEIETICDSDVAVHMMSGIDERDITGMTNDALDVATDGTDGVHISLDPGWLDPREVLGVGTPVRGGMTYREVHTTMKFVARSEATRSSELVEVNPIPDEHSGTATLATKLVANASDKYIL